MWNLIQWLKLKVSLRHFLSRALAAPVFSRSKPFVQFWEKVSRGTVLWNYFEFGPKVQEEMPVKGISYLDILQPFCSAECNNPGRVYYEEHFCEIILNLGQWFRRKGCLKKNYLELWRPSCLVKWNHLCTFEKGIMGNIHVK